MAQGSTSVPLCVDLDGTVIYSDLLFESLAWVLGRKPWLLLLTPFWLLSGRAVLKRRLAEAVGLDPAALPYNHAVLDWLRSEKLAGRTLILATAADERLARSVADFLGIFDQIAASNGVDNLKAGVKLALLEKLIAGPFDYVGNSPADLPLWSKCREAIVANASPSLIERARAKANVTRVFPRDPRAISSLLRCLRPHQWLKNLLVFLPLIAAHRLFDVVGLFKALQAFAAFCLCASAVYLVNDLADLPADRLHPTKCRRPFASGEIPLPVAALLIPLLLALSLLLVIPLPLLSLAVLAGYFLLSTAYSLLLKRKVLLDVFTLASLYTLRVVMGHVSAVVPFSPWLLSFSFFVFLSLAYCKRTAELYRLRQSGGGAAPGRQYHASDLELLTLFGTSSGFAASLILTLYLNSDTVQQLYRRPLLLWLWFPLLLYWVMHIWTVAHRGKMNEDPILFAAKDGVTYLVVAIGAIVMILAARPFGWLP